MTYTVSSGTLNPTQLNPFTNTLHPGDVVTGYTVTASSSAVGLSCGVALAEIFLQILRIYKVTTKSGNI